MEEQNAQRTRTEQQFQEGRRKPAELGLGRKRSAFRKVAGSGELELLRDYA